MASAPSTVVAPEGGAIAIFPLRAGQVYFDIARANYLPRNVRHGDANTEVLNIGRNVEIRASGNAEFSDGRWNITYFTACQFPSRRDLTPAQQQRALAIVREIIETWAAANGDAIDQADAQDRANAAGHLRENIARHERALAILSEQLDRCESGESFTEFPGLPTKR